jgi:hypothetical protein
MSKIDALAFQRASGFIPVVRTVLLAASLSFCTGCIKVRITVKLNEDGTGQVVEDLVFGEKLVDAAKRLKDVPTIEELTSDETVKRRLAQMGKGVSLVSKKVEKQTDGSTRMLVVYAFDDISELRLASFPFGAGWEETRLKFTLKADTSLAAEYFLSIVFERPKKETPANPPPLSERDAQQIRQLLPIFKDMLAGFELKLRLEVYDPKKWATTTKGHMASGPYLAPVGGQLTVFHLTDKHLLSSDDGLMLIVPWRQVGRELDLESGADAGGRRLQLLPHVHFIDRGAMHFKWRAIQTPRGREYY